MIESGSFLSLSSPVSTTDDFCKYISLIWHGDELDYVLEELSKQERQSQPGVENLSDKILYAPNLQIVEDISQNRPRRIGNLQELRACLESVQHAVGHKILASSMILTPDKMQQAVTNNPWDALMGVRPMIFFHAKVPPDGVTIQFAHSGVCYQGWHMRIALKRLFDCNLYSTNMDDLPRSKEAAAAKILPLISNNVSGVGKGDASAQGRYIINPNGTVIDRKNNLMWQRCCVGQTFDGNTCTGEASTMTLDDANAAKVRDLSLRSILGGHSQSWPTFAGHKDWRLPTIEELRSLVWCSNGTPQEEAWKYGCGGVGNRNGSYQKPTIDIQAFPNTPLWQFWSTTNSAYSSSLSRAWVVYFGGGCVSDFAGSYKYSVRLVRENKQL